MPSHRVQLRRREWITWSATALAAWVFGGRRVAQASVGLAEAPLRDGAGRELPLPTGEALLAPYGEGARLARWTIERSLPISHGTLNLILRDQDGASFQLDVYARDTAADAPRPPGRSAAFDVFLANGGQGDLPSLEEHGLAAMAVAAVLQQNEARVTARGFVTMRERLAADRASVLRLV